MDDTAYADAVRMTPVSILKLPLRPYALGHELLLLRWRNPLLVASPDAFNLLPAGQQSLALAQAVWFCCNTHRENERQPLALLKVKIWKWRSRRENFPLAIAEFRNYLGEGRSCPRLSRRRLKSGEEPGRPFGAPLLAQLYQFVLTLPEIQHSGNPVAAAWDFPFGAAAWRYFVKLETEGAVQIENDEELESRLTTEKIQREYAAEESAQEATCPE